MRFTYYYIFSVAYFFTFIINKISGKPYQYSYFIQQPGQYHSLHVKNGAAFFNNISPYEPKTYFIPSSESSGEPTFRQGRFGPGFVEQNPFPRPFSGRNPENDGTNNFPQRREQNPYTPSEVDPFFNQPRRRYPQNNFPREDNGIRFNSQPPDLGRPYPENNFNNFRSEFPGKTFNTYYQQLKVDDRQIKIKSQNNNNIKPQMVLEIDETRDREEVSTTTPNSCIFCGVNEVNPQDAKTINPDSENVDPINVSSNSVPPFLIANNVANKRTDFQTLIPYFVVA